MDFSLINFFFPLQIIHSILREKESIELKAKMDEKN